jgi:hypothetical protein
LPLQRPALSSFLHTIYHLHICICSLHITALFNPQPYNPSKYLSPRSLVRQYLHLESAVAHLSISTFPIHSPRSSTHECSLLRIDGRALVSFARGDSATMYERESSIASSVDFYEMHNEASPAKRRAEDDSTLADKRRKLDTRVALPVSRQSRQPARLPPSVWQHIFSFCSLADLGRLMQVNRPFRSYLTDVSNVSLSKPEHGCLPLLKSEALWASARNAHNSNTPKPLPGLTEQQMWQLVWSKRCQFCNKLSTYTSGEKIWQQGPGDAGVRTIWPFAIRACGPCLMQRCQTVSWKHILYFSC